jgi:hypothetical protein
MRAEALLGLRRACHVWLSSLIADTSASLLGDAVDPLVGAVDGASMAAANAAAVEDVLDSQVDVDTLALAGNLDTIAEGRDSTMSPARAAVLRNVLIAAHGAHALVAPRECGWIALWGSEHLMGVRLGAVATEDDAKLLTLLTAEELALASSREHKNRGNCSGLHD